MPETMTTASNVALLAPVPMEHLIDGQQVVQSDLARGMRIP